MIRLTWLSVAFLFWNGGMRALAQSQFPSPVYEYHARAIDAVRENPAACDTLLKPFAVDNPLRGGGSFSVLCEVSASVLFGRESYTIAGSRSESGEKPFGWELGVQPNGAWYFLIGDSANTYLYEPIPARQRLLMDPAAVIGFSFDAAKQETWLYYNGTNVAILHTPGIMRVQDSKLFVGGRVRGDIGLWERLNGTVHRLQLYDSACPPEFFVQNQRGRIDAMVQQPADSLLTVMTFNIWHGGRETGKESGVLRTAELIRQSGAGIVAVQETYGSGAIIADLLGYYYYLRSSNLSILSRYPIAATGPAIHPFYHGSAYIDIPQRGRLLFSNVWLNYPFDYWDDLHRGLRPDSVQWVEAMQRINADTMRAVLQSLASASIDREAVPVIIAGDFNSGSHLDWTLRNRAVNRGCVIPFPVTLLLQQAGFTDSYRALHPDETRDRGLTWSPYILNSHPDRIDYIFYRSGRLIPLQSFTSEADNCHPSDHRGVVTRFRWR